MSAAKVRQLRGEGGEDLAAAAEPTPVGAPAPGPMSLRALLSGAPSQHRGAVAQALALPRDALPDEIAATILSRDRIRAIVSKLSPDARLLAARAGFLGEAIVDGSWSGRPSGPAGELERYGLAFAFRRSYELTYVVPRELRRPLADALAAPYAPRGLRAARPERVVRAPLQLAHDVATLWAHLARSPARVKTNGVIYQRDVPRLLDALPPLELHGPADPMAGNRLSFVLQLLREERLVRARVDDRPGGGGRCELVPTGDPAALLAQDAAAVGARLLARISSVMLGGAALALADALAPGTTVTLTSFGALLRAMHDEIGIELPYASDFSLALGGLHFPWLAGVLGIGFDAHGVPEAVCAEPAPLPAAGRLLCQGNFEVIALSPPTPAQRLVLALACEPVPGQAHVFRLTRESVRAAQRSGALTGGVTEALQRLVGEIPQNVARSLADWTSSVRRPLRIRTAMMLDAGDRETADALRAGELAPFVVERLGPAQLAIRTEDVKSIERALKRVGHELEVGVDRVSGRFTEREPVRGQAELVWEPVDEDGPQAGEQVSTSAQACGRAASRPDRPAPRALSAPSGQAALTFD